MAEFIYFASFTGYEYDFFEVISNLHIQGSKFGGKFDKFGGKFDKFGGTSLKKLNFAEFMEFVFSKSENMTILQILAVNNNSDKNIFNVN